jgi:hypothetical protein
LLSHAVEDALILYNVALKPGKFLPHISKRRSISPLTREEAAAFVVGVVTLRPVLRLLCALPASYSWRQQRLDDPDWNPVSEREDAT